MTPRASHGVAAGAPADAARRRRLRAADAALTAFARGCGVAIIVMLVALIAVLTVNSVPSIRRFGWSFIVSSEWRPNEIERPLRDEAGRPVIEDGEVVTEVVRPSFGALPVIVGTAVSSLLAIAVAVPLSLGAALFLVRVAPRLRIAGILSFLVEFLAAIPSIAYGIWGLFVLAPFLQQHLEPAIRRVLGGVPGFHWLFFESVTIGNTVVEREIPLTGRDMLCGGLILGIMILPIITAVSRDVLRAVPKAQIEGTVAMGATWWQSSAGMLRYSRSGLFGAVMLGLARAAGETMAVTMVIGNSNRISASLFAPAQTMSSLIANEFAEASDLHRSALLEIAIILLIMSLILNIVARWFVVGGSARTAAAH
ncbi:MAG: phosphate ABC transporter permease subunit PstC [Phycisphaeraceae bacterium]|nr:phosphate ABC transporter permease subunit PstC [Phycisphaeraceae bacterium]